MKVKIGTPFIRQSSDKLLEAGQIVEDFTEDELKKYSGLYSVPSETAEEVEKKVKAAEKEKLTSKSIKVNKT